MGNDSYIALLVPGHLPRELENAFHLSIGSLVIDIVNTTPENEWLTAAYLISEAINEYSDFKKKVTISMPFHNEERLYHILSHMANCPIHSIRVHNISSSGELDRFESILQDTLPMNQSTCIELVVDHIKALESLEQICSRSKRIHAVIPGAYALLYSMSDEKRRRGILMDMKKRIVGCANALGLKAIDSTYVNYLDADKFEHDCRVSNEMGFIGRTFVHPSQINKFYKMQGGTLS